MKGPDQLVEQYERFNILYDILITVNENGTVKESVIASKIPLDREIIHNMLDYLQGQGLVKTLEGYEFKTTSIGASFLEEFKGMRKFLS